MQARRLGTGWVVLPEPIGHHSDQPGVARRCCDPGAVLGCHIAKRRALRPVGNRPSAAPSLTLSQRRQPGFVRPNAGARRQPAPPRAARSTAGRVCACTGCRGRGPGPGGRRQGRRSVSIRMPSLRKTLILRFTEVSFRLVQRRILPLEGRRSGMSPLASSARTMMICFRAAHLNRGGRAGFPTRFG